MRREDKERLKEIIDEINALDAIVIVEGKKDVKSIKLLGIKHKVIPIANIAIYEIYEELLEIQKTTTILDFLDNDKEGLILLKSLKNKGIKMNSKYKKEICRIMNIKTIESIKTKIIK